jgi:hypothetical protein
VKLELLERFRELSDLLGAEWGVDEVMSRLGTFGRGG